MSQASLSSDQSRAIQHQTRHKQERRKYYMHDSTFAVCMQSLIMLTPKRNSRQPSTKTVTWVSWEKAWVGTTNSNRPNWQTDSPNVGNLKCRKSERKAQELHLAMPLPEHSASTARGKSVSFGSTSQVQPDNSWQQQDRSIIGDARSSVAIFFLRCYGPKKSLLVPSDRPISPETVTKSSSHPPFFKLL